MARKIQWAGLTWTVRGTSATTQGPGANWWSDSASSVWVDTAGKLHLKLRKEGTRWLAPEIYTDRTFKYGTFVWKIEGPTSSATGVLDKNVVLGLFTYQSSDLNNEIDIELARWGNASWPNLNYTVYPSRASLWDAQQKASYVKSSEMTLQGNYTTQMFTWTSSQVRFSSKYGHSAGASSILDWNTPNTPAERVPQSACSVHMNLWICNGQSAPSNGQEVEFVIHSFTYSP
ncbi:hypothetical protein KC19_7G019200 [Ceratodon purpureus]|uniref:GH16 domain-containing protein n=1 Tax=Ceratodon purpureus TaxID=3225 RepID=A0A8T0H597_CERPU|nr:hypothetical protein KC19_7G019200 [Ceratodon purpureus]